MENIIRTYVSYKYKHTHVHIHHWKINKVKSTLAPLNTETINKVPEPSDPTYTWKKHMPYFCNLKYSRLNVENQQQSSFNFFNLSIKGH